MAAGNGVVALVRSFGCDRGRGGKFLMLPAQARKRKHRCESETCPLPKSERPARAGRFTVPLASTAGTLAPARRRRFLLTRFTRLHVMPLASQILQHTRPLDLLLEGLERPLDTVDVVQLHFDHAGSSSSRYGDDACLAPAVIGQNMVFPRGEQQENSSYESGVRDQGCQGLGGRRTDPHVSWSLHPDTP